MAACPRGRTPNHPQSPRSPPSRGRLSPDLQFPCIPVDGHRCVLSIPELRRWAQRPFGFPPWAALSPGAVMCCRTMSQCIGAPRPLLDSGRHQEAPYKVRTASSPPCQRLLTTYRLWLAPRRATIPSVTPFPPRPTFLVKSVHILPVREAFEVVLFPHDAHVRP